MILRVNSIVGLYIPDELASKEDAIRAVLAARVVTFGYTRDVEFSEEKFTISFESPKETDNGTQD